ncbi:hypothetical protein IAT40_006442 [Kwoniella sp. CBS 6097]
MPSAMQSCIDLSTSVVDITPTPLSHRRRHSQSQKRRRDRKVYESPPIIAERESSLYLPSPPQFEYPFDQLQLQPDSSYPFATYTIATSLSSPVQAQAQLCIPRSTSPSPSPTIYNQSSSSSTENNQDDDVDKHNHNHIIDIDNTYSSFPSSFPCIHTSFRDSAANYQYQPHSLDHNYHPSEYYRNRRNQLTSYSTGDLHQPSSFGLSHQLQVEGQDILGLQLSAIPAFTSHSSPTSRSTSLYIGNNNNNNNKKTNIHTPRQNRVTFADQHQHQHQHPISILVTQDRLPTKNNSSYYCHHSSNITGPGTDTEPGSETDTVYPSHTHTHTHTRPQSKSRLSPFYTKKKFTSKSLISLFHSMSSPASKLQDGGALGVDLRGDGDHIASKTNNSADDMTAPPPVPARSRLRTVPTPKLTSSPNFSSPNLLSASPVPDASSTVGEGSSSIKVLTHRKSSLFRLPVDQPIAQNISSPIPSPVSPAFSSGSPALNGPASPNAGETSFGFGRRKASRALNQDPHKVRDGMMAKTSSSGVYTPSTFPGAQGPRPSHFPTHVYTPTSFTLYPAQTPISPSASSTHSSSSSQSDSTAPPRTPISPTGRIGKAMTNIRRFSSTITQVKEKPNHNHQRAITTPMLESDYYMPPSSSFESSTTHSRQSSWGPQTPVGSKIIAPPIQHSDSGYFPPLSSHAGLGFGLPEQPHENQMRRLRTSSTDATVIIDAGADPLNFGVLDKKEIIMGQVSSVVGSKSKRKPVPKILGQEIEETHAY